MCGSNVVKIVLSFTIFVVEEHVCLFHMSLFAIELLFLQDCNW